MAQTTTPAATQERVYVTLEDGRSVPALTIDRVNSIINGMVKNGKVLTAEDNGKYIKGLKIVGDGNAYSGPIGLRYIYNVDLLSHAAYTGNGPKKMEALAAMQKAKQSGDLLEMHNACREFMNAITVSFSLPSQKFTNNQLIKAQVDVVTTDNGSLITLKNVAEMEAETLKPRAEIKYDLSALVDGFNPTELISKKAPIADENALS